MTPVAHRTHPIPRKFARITFAAATLFLCALRSLPASIVWDLNPLNQNSAAGSSNVSYTSGGFTITAYGYNYDLGVSTAQELYFKNAPGVDGAIERSLGVTNTFDQELQVRADGSPLDFIQFDIAQLLAGGLTDGRISVGSVQPNESFKLFGSNSLGTLGTQLGGPSSLDDTFIDLPNFGLYRFYSVVANEHDVLPVALSAEVPVVPEAGAFLPVIALLGSIFTVRLFARRRLPA